VSVTESAVVPSFVALIVTFVSWSWYVASTIRMSVFCWSSRRSLLSERASDTSSSPFDTAGWIVPKAMNVPAKTMAAIRRR